MSLHDIDRLFKSAFRTDEYAYKNAYWKDFESKLGPPKRGGYLGKILAASAIIFSGLFINSDQLNFSNSTGKAIAEKTQEKRMGSLLSTSSMLLNPFKKEEHASKNYKSNRKLVAINRAPQLSIAHKQKSESELQNKEIVNAQQTIQSVKDPLSGLSSQNINSIDLENVDQSVFSKIKSFSLSSINIKSKPSALDGPLPDETEFGGKIKQSSLTQYYIQGGVYYLKLNPDNVDQNNIPQNFEKEFKSFSMSGGEIVVGMKRKGFKIASGIGVSSISKTYSYKFNEEHISTNTKINTSTYLHNVDSSFSHYEISEFENGNSSNFDIATAVYNVDSNFVTVSDTSTTTSSEITENNVALAYQLNYLNIPIQVGYELEMKRFFVGINAALQLGVLTNYNGFKYEENTENSRSSITSKDLNPVTLNYTVSVGAGYNITPTISVIAQPIYSSSIVGAFKDIKPNKISGLGGNLALRYQF